MWTFLYGFVTHWNVTFALNKQKLIKQWWSITAQWPLISKSYIWRQKNVFNAIPFFFFFSLLFILFVFLCFFFFVYFLVRCKCIPKIYCRLLCKNILSNIQLLLLLCHKLQVQHSVKKIEIIISPWNILLNTIKHLPYRCYLTSGCVI